MSDLKTRTYRGAFWSAVDAIGVRFVQFVIGVVLARILLPEQFGLIGMLAIFMAVTQSLLNSGFSAALIQKEEVTSADSSSVFYFNIAISIVLAGSLWLASPWIAAFYDQPVLTRLTRAFSVIVLIDAVTVVQTAMLTRNMEFRLQTKVSLIAGVGSGIVGIVLAYQGYGVWSLVWQQISRALLRAVMLWVFHSWRPAWVFSATSLATMFKFGSRLLVSGLLSRAFENIYYVVIGRLFTPADLGFYTRARQLEELPSHTLASVITRVSLPAFSAIQNDNARLQRGLRKALAAITLLNAPVMVGLAVVAEPLVLVLLTERWLPSVPYLEVMCVLGLMYPLHALNLNILMAKGRSDLFLRLEIARKALVIIAIAVSWRWGIVALIVGQILVSVLSFLVNTYYTKKLLQYGPLRQIRDVGIYLFLAAIMGIVVYAVGWIDLPSDALLLTLQVAAGSVVYLVLCICVRPSAYVEVCSAIRERFTDKSPQGRFISRIMAIVRSKKS